MQESKIKEIVELVIKELTKKDEQAFPVEISARHVHLCEKHIEKLFGEGYQMTVKKELSQPGQFQYNERVTLIGPKGVIKNVAILGPPRNKTQVEVSNTDARALGIKPPVRESGNLDGSQSIFIAGDKGVVEALESTIVAKRHIHMDTKDAKRLGVKDKEIVAVRVKGDRPIVFEEVVVRVSDAYKLSMHIDFDEANAAGLNKNAHGEIVKL
ncbi:phosphate propanoyltransferase [Clostridiaceae bacterium M8S5]|nr:phosphate propanoyltransferase [Clostridiaceae bacterium M8S5]